MSIFQGAFSHLLYQLVPIPPYTFSHCSSQEPWVVLSVYIEHTALCVDERCRLLICFVGTHIKNADWWEMFWKVWLFILFIYFFKTIITLQIVLPNKSLPAWWSMSLDNESWNLYYAQKLFFSNKVLPLQISPTIWQHLCVAAFVHEEHDINLWILSEQSDYSMIWKMRAKLVNFQNWSHMFWSSLLKSKRLTAKNIICSFTSRQVVATSEVSPKKNFIWTISRNTPFH